MNEPHLPTNKIAILGATSQIARDLVVSFATNGGHDLTLFARRPEAVVQWLEVVGLGGRYAVADFSVFDPDQHFDVILNFVGVGNPALAVAMGASILDVTLKYDELVLNYLRYHPDCRYLFLSSGAVYGSNFEQPVDENSKATIAINHLKSQDWYAIAKLYAECRHRSLAHLPIVDIRVFNYFSHTQDMEARFLITDIVRAIRNKTVLKISCDYMVRDYIGPDNFYQLVNAILTSSATNDVVDCYSKEPIDKHTLLTELQANFGLQYEFVQTATGINATGNKPYYYSTNKRAANFGYVSTLNSLMIIHNELKYIIKT